MSRKPRKAGFLALSYTMLCFAMLRFSMLYYAMMCPDMLCHVKLRDVMYFLLGYARLDMLCYGMLGKVSETQETNLGGLDILGIFPRRPIGPRVFSVSFPGCLGSLGSSRGTRRQGRLEILDFLVVLGFECDAMPFHAWLC